MPTLREFLRAAEAAYVARVLTLADSVSDAVRIAGVHRAHWYELRRKHGAPIKQRAKRRASNEVSRLLSSWSQPRVES